MLSKLWVAQDLFAELQAVSVLLVLVTSLRQKKTEQTLNRGVRGPHQAAALFLPEPLEKVHQIQLVLPAVSKHSITCIINTASSTVLSA